MIPQDMGVCKCQDVNLRHRTRYSEPSTRHPTQWPRSSKTTRTGTAGRSGSRVCSIASLCRPSGRALLTCSQRIASLRTRAARSDDTAATQPLARLCWLLPGASSCGARVRCAPAPRCGPWCSGLVPVGRRRPRLRSLGGVIWGIGRSGGPRARPPGVVRRLRRCRCSACGAAACLGGSSWCSVLGGGRCAPFNRASRRGGSARCGVRPYCGRIRSTCGGPAPVLARG